MHLYKFNKLFSFIVVTIILFSLTILFGYGFYKIDVREAYMKQLLKNQIMLDYPELDDLNASDFQKVSLLREWVHSHVDRSSPKGDIKERIKGLSTPELYVEFEKNTGGVDCSGISYALVRVYELFGYESYSYHTGNLDGFNHVVTLVKIQHEGSIMWNLQDATYDTTMKNTTGQPYDFIAMLTDLKNGNQDTMVITQGDSPSYDYICIAGDSCDADFTVPDGEAVALYKTKHGTKTLEENKSMYLTFRGLEGLNSSIAYEELVSRIEELLL